MNTPQTVSSVIANRSTKVVTATVTPPGDLAGSRRTGPVQLTVAPGSAAQAFLPRGTRLSLVIGDSGSATPTMPTDQRQRGGELPAVGSRGESYREVVVTDDAGGTRIGDLFDRGGFHPTRGMDAACLDKDRGTVTVANRAAADVSLFFADCRAKNKVLVPKGQQRSIDVVASASLSYWAVGADAVAPGETSSTGACTVFAGTTLEFLQDGWLVSARMPAR